MNVENRQCIALAVFCVKNAVTIGLFFCTFVSLILVWGTEKIAKTYGYIGFVPGEGLYIKLVCVEKNPLRIYKKDQDPVYKDSAMEAFFQFKGNDTADEM